MSFKSQLVIIIAFIGFSYSSFAQLEKIDSLLGRWSEIEKEESSINEGEKITLLINIANYYKYNNPDTAVIFSNILLDFSLQINNEEAQIQAHQILCTSRYILGEFNISSQHANKVLELSKRLNHQEGLAFAYNSIGLSYQIQEKYKQAKQSFFRALNIALANSDTLLIIKSYFNISLAYDEIGKSDSALYFIDKCYKKSYETGNIFYQAMSLNRKGVTYFHLNDFDEAIAYHLKAIELIEVNNKWELCYAYAGLSEAYNSINKNAQSLKYGKMSLDIAKRINAKWEALRTSKIISDNYKSQGDYENAYLYFSIHKNYSDSIFNEKKDNEINALHLKQSQAEKKTLQLENNYQLELLTQRGIQLIYMGLGLSVLVILIIVLYYSINYRKRYSDKIATQRDELKKMNLSKDKILSVIAHDMRSPLGNILNILYLISETESEVEKKELNQLYIDVEERVHSVTATLDNLLNWAMNQFNKSQPNPQQVNLNEIIEEQIDLCEFDARKKNIELKFENELHINNHAYIDIEQIRIIIRNLIANAIKFTNQDGHIFIKFRDQENNIIIDIIDNGIGMTEKTISDLFTSSVHSQSGTLDEIGTGLGLALCKEYIEINGGKISVVSEHEKGSTFSVYIKK